MIFLGGVGANYKQSVVALFGINIFVHSVIRLASVSVDAGPNDPRNAERPAQFVESGVKRRLQPVVLVFRRIGNDDCVDDREAESRAQSPAEEDGPFVQRHPDFGAQQEAEGHPHQIRHRAKGRVLVKDFGEASCVPNSANYHNLINFNKICRYRIKLFCSNNCMFCVCGFKSVKKVFSPTVISLNSRTKKYIYFVTKKKHFTLHFIQTHFA